MNNEESVTIPIAETFMSIQGEGVWTGTPMLFIRVAGCNVGKYQNWPLSTDLGAPIPIMQDRDLPLMIEKKHSICTTITGEQFLCDTNYHAAQKMTLGELETLILDSNLRHICITGGEPLLYQNDLDHVMYRCLGRRQLRFHIETSGTVEFKLNYYCRDSASGQVWVTCSPKAGCKKIYPNEWKFLYWSDPSSDHIEIEKDDEAFAAVVASTTDGSNAPVYIQPINSVGEVDRQCVQRGLRLLMRHPEWRMSVQMHKLLSLR